MSSLLEMEDFVSQCVKVFESRMREFAESGQAVDMAHWLQCYAFDVIGEITVRSCTALILVTTSLMPSSLQSVLDSWTRAKTWVVQCKLSRHSYRTRQKWV